AGARARRRAVGRSLDAAAGVLPAHHGGRLDAQGTVPLGARVRHRHRRPAVRIAVDRSAGGDGVFRRARPGGGGRPVAGGGLGRGDLADGGGLHAGGRNIFSAGVRRRFGRGGGGRRGAGDLSAARHEGGAGASGLI